MPEKLKVKYAGSKSPNKNMPQRHIAGRTGSSFPIVGIGGSAGGLEAFQEFLKNLSAELGMAYIFVMHLSPKYKSMLVQLLSRETKMPVNEVKSGTALQSNQVYVIPPHAGMYIKNGKLNLYRMKEHGMNMPINTLFCSLAKEKGKQAVGIIFSGTATDGTLGASAIKAGGGITFAQDDKSAKYGSMPQSAISTGCIDFVLTPKKIAAELGRIAKKIRLARPGPVTPEESPPTAEQSFKNIFDILSQDKGLDFSHYKFPTVRRRVTRRMILHKMKNLPDYVKFLRKNKSEADSLYEDLLINVTGFFREPKVFDALRKQVLPAILKDNTKNQMVRIWVPGCSSGEEVYSIAICLLEVLGKKTRDVPVRIFATDVSEAALARARRGIYDNTVKNQITPGCLKKYFTKIDGFYKVSKKLRELCVFSTHNVFSDPPFSNLDLISCRNLLIYLQQVLQKNIVHKFHYALKPGGFLLLGHSESANGYSNLFEKANPRQKIYINKSRVMVPKHAWNKRYDRTKSTEMVSKKDNNPVRETDIEAMVERIVLDEYAPCGVLIDNNLEVVLFRGHTGRYLESATGKPSHNLFKLAREGLGLPLRAAIYKARKTKQTIKREIENVKFNGHRMRIIINVVPMKSAISQEEYFMVFFDEMTRPVLPKRLPKTRGESGEEEKYAESLQKELAETKEYLQSVIEEQETAIEEVKTANEEMLSNNEELQSINEELETAKEELQSSNEELITTNEELNNRNAEVSLLNNDLINLLGSIDMPVVMLGTDLVIRRITSQCEKVLNIIAADIGRPIGKIKLNADIPGLEKILLGVIESLNPRTFEVKSPEGNWYSVYVKPYRTSDNKIEGVVVIFIDTTAQKQAKQMIEEARAYAENIVEAMREPLIVLDTDLKIISANRSFYQTFKLDAQKTPGRVIYNLGNQQWDIPELRRLLEEVCLRNRVFDNYELEHHFEDLGTKTLLLNVRRLSIRPMILITIDDITEHRRMEKELSRLKEKKYQTLIENLPQKVFLKDTNSVYISCNENYARDLKIKPEEIVGKTDYDFYPKELADKYHADDLRIRTAGITEEIEERYIQDGQERYVHTLKACLRDDRNNVIGLFGLFWDITKRKQAEEALKQAYDELKQTQTKLICSERLAVLGKLAATVGHELRNPLGVIRNSVYFLRTKLGPTVQDEKFKRHLNILEEEIIVSDKIVSDVLAFSRIKEPLLAETDINDSITALLETINITENIKVISRLNHELPHISADRVQLRQLFYNLIFNAIQAMPEGGELAIANRANNEMLEVDIMDTGVGISPEIVAEIFNPFFTTKNHGTGLGLLVCQSIMEAHKGSITVESEMGKGTKFTVKFPMH
ncbi:MAG: PAS domain-containing protein [Candidatus Omnitrophica bacterium]|nr:PAS domain-containing protein [Candidatus Omnitrophota bacterium]